MASHGNNFNYSIWFVELRGTTDPQLVQAALHQLRAEQEKAAWSLTLNFLREKQNSLLEQLMQQVPHVQGWEAPLVSRLREEMAACPAGNLSSLEAFIEANWDGSMLSEYLQLQPHCVHWEQIPPDSSFPSPRGGHQLVLDQASNCLWLFGGWDGQRDLGDLWRFDLTSAKWHCEQEAAQEHGGPKPRSCHKMVLHAASHSLILIGRYLDGSNSDQQQQAGEQGDLWRFDIDKRAWQCLSRDTRANGGPGLIYDQQVVVDERRSCLWVFGGRVSQPPAPANNPNSANSEATYSGLYRYDLSTGRWSLIRADGPEGNSRQPTLRARVGHSMLLDPHRDQLHILAGQRHKDYLADHLIWDLSTSTGRLTQVVKEIARRGGPEAGFTQRALLIAEGQEAASSILLYAGLTRESHRAQTLATSEAPAPPIPRNHLWRLDLKHTGRWMAVRVATTEEPAARYAHQMLHDPRTGYLWLFGGNPGDPQSPRRRLSDLWRARVTPHLQVEQVKRRLRFAIRRQAYLELCLDRQRGSPATTQALRYLQQEVASQVDHGDGEEAANFQQLSTWLFHPPITADQGREELLTVIISHLPKDMQPPAQRLGQLAWSHAS